MDNISYSYLILFLILILIIVVYYNRITQKRNKYNECMENIPTIAETAPEKLPETVPEANPDVACGLVLFKNSASGIYILQNFIGQLRTTFISTPYKDLSFSFDASGYLIK